MRHAKAKVESRDGLDASRELAPAGFARLDEKMPLFKERLRDVDLILTSPFARARQTADYLASTLDKEKVLRVTNWLHAQNFAENIVTELEAMHQSEEVLVVGHNPWITDLVLLLSQKPCRCDVHLKTAALAHIRFEEGFGVARGHVVEVL